MNEVPEVHPSVEELSAFSLGQLDEEASAAIESHLAGCPTCCRRLETVPRGRLRRPAARGRPAGNHPRIHSRTTTAFAPALTLGWGRLARDAGELPAELARHPRYRVLKSSAPAAWATVYKAEHRLMERPVALKVIRRDLTSEPAAVERFRREVKARRPADAPQHRPRLRRRTGRRPHFLVMEFVEGTTWPSWSPQEGPLPVARACDYVRQAALGLQHAFEHGMVHRDIKPQNLMRTPRRAGQDPRFRPGPLRPARCALAAGPRRRRRPAADASPLTQTGIAHGHAGLHGPRAGRRRPRGRHPGRHLQPRLHPLLPPRPARSPSPTAADLDKMHGPPRAAAASR